MQFAATHLRECSGKQSSLNLCIFLFFFCFVEMFQFSFDCESSLKFFSAEFSVEFSFSCLTCRISVVDFRSILLLFLGKLFTFTVWNINRLFKKRVTKPFCWLKFSCLQFGPRIRTEDLNSNSDIKRGSFLVPYCLGFLLSFPLWPNQVPHVVSLIFFLEINLYISSLVAVTNRTNEFADHLVFFKVTGRLQEN